MLSPSRPTASLHFILYRLAGIVLIALASHARAQEAPQSTAATEDEGTDIVVTAPRTRGSVETDVPPDLELDPVAIESYGASNITDLLAALSTQTRTGRGRDGGAPVVLLNGRRISDLSEIRDIPSEAIQRVETFPEEVALRYGYSADQRVVNFMLKSEFAAYSGEAEFGGPTSGARTGGQLRATSLQIGKDGRTNFSAQYDRASSIFESERGIVQPMPGQAENRTLLPATEQIQLNSVVNRNLDKRTSATLNLKFDQTRSASAFGRSTTAAGVPERLDRNALVRTASAGLTLDGNVGKWQWTGTSTYGVDTSRTLTDQTASPETRDVARSRQTIATTVWTATGPFAELPAGAVTASIRAGFERRGFRSSSIRRGIAQQARLGQSDTTLRASLDIPLASRKRNSIAPLGDLSINLNAAYRLLQNFGGLKSYGYGINWSPSRSLHLIASLAAAEGAPSQQQLSNPLVTSPGTTVYDYARGESALVTIIGGGNPLLRTESTRDLKIGLSYEVPKIAGLTLSTNYFRNRSNNPLSVFPELTPDVESAFPNRVVRDSAGRLISIDRRTINYVSASSDELRWEINFSKQSGPQGRAGIGALAAAGRFPGSGTGAGRGSFRGAGPGKRVQLSLSHTIKLRDEIRIASTLPPLDLLNGDATGAFGGTPEHRVDLEGGWYNNGLGMRATAAWQSGTRISGGLVPSGGAASDLRFSGLATINLRIFLNFDQRKKLVEQAPFLKGSRIRLRINNVTNAIRDVRDNSGATPLRYQRGYLEPIGRTIDLSFRKIF